MHVPTLEDLKTAITGRRALLYFFVCLPALVPLLCPYLPFQDWGGHVGMLGAAIHRDNPEARIGEHFRFEGWLQPNILYFWIGALLGKILPPLAAANGALAIVLAGIGIGTMYLCRAADADERLAILATPVAVGWTLHHGFVPNLAGLVMFTFALGVYLRFRERPTWKLGAAFVLCLALMALAHFFVFAAGAGLILLLVVMDAFGRPRVALVGFVGWVVAAALVFSSLSSVAGGDAAGYKSIVDQVINADRGAVAFWLWGALFRVWPDLQLDELFQWTWVLLVCGAALAAIALERLRFLTSVRARLLVLFAVTFAMAIILPRKLGPPIDWWGVNLRLPSMMALLAIPLIGRELTRRVRFLLPVLAAPSVLFVLYNLWDIREWNRTEMAGFTEVLDAVPPGLKITAINHWQPRHMRYVDRPLGYVGGYYVLRRGGFVNGTMAWRSGMVFGLTHPDIPGTPWHDAGPFNIGHARAFDGVIVRTRADARKEAPFEGAAQKEVKLVKEAGNWRFYVLRGSRGEAVTAGKKG